MFPFLVFLPFLLLTNWVIGEETSSTEIVTSTEIITSTEEMYTVFIPHEECNGHHYLNYSYDPRIIHIGIEKSEFSFNLYFSYKGRKQIANLRKIFHLPLHNDAIQQFFVFWTGKHRIFVYYLPPDSDYLKFQELTPSTYGRYIKWDEKAAGFYKNGTTYYGRERDVYFNRTLRFGPNGPYDREWCKLYGHNDVVNKYCMSQCNFRSENVSSDMAECVYDPYLGVQFTVMRTKSPAFHWNAYYMSYACNIFLESSIYDYPTDIDENQPSSVLFHWYKSSIEDGDQLELDPSEATCYILDGGNHILLDFDNPPSNCTPLNITLPVFRTTAETVTVHSTTEPYIASRVEKEDDKIMQWIMVLGLTVLVFFSICFSCFFVRYIPASRPPPSPLLQSSGPTLTSPGPAQESSGLPEKEPSSGAVGGNMEQHQPSSSAVGGKKKKQHEPSSGAVGGNMEQHQPSSGAIGGKKKKQHAPSSGAVGGNMEQHQPSSSAVGGKKKKQHEPSSGAVGGNMEQHQPSSGAIGGKKKKQHAPSSGAVGGNMGQHQPSSSAVGGNMEQHQPSSGAVGGKRKKQHAPSSGAVGGNMGQHQPSSGAIGGKKKKQHAPSSGAVGGKKRKHHEPSSGNIV